MNKLLLINDKQYQKVLGLAEQIVGCASRINYNGYDEYDIYDITIMLSLKKEETNFKNRWMVKLTNPKNYHEAVTFASTPEQALKLLLEIIQD